MSYKLKIIRTEANPTYAEEFAKWKDDRRYAFRDSGDQPPFPTVVENALEVELSSEQFEAVKKAVIQQFK